MLRVLLFDLLLCHLYAPETHTEEATWAGSHLKSFRTKRMCFPAVPILPTHARPFRESIGVSPSFDFKQLQYEQVCDHEAVSHMYNAIGSPSTIEVVLFGALFRGGEAVDALNNFAASRNHTLTDQEVAAYIVCGFAQLGGVLYTAFAVCVLLLCLACVAPACLCGSLCFNSFANCCGCCFVLGRATKNSIESMNSRQGYRRAGSSAASSSVSGPDGGARV